MENSVQRFIYSTLQYEELEDLANEMTIKQGLLSDERLKQIAREKELIQLNGIYGKFKIKGITIHAVPAYNKNHDRSQCVGYILFIDDKIIYASGDTSITYSISAKLLTPLLTGELNRFLSNKLAKNK